MKFSDIVDLYNYLPVKVIKDKNQSNDLIHHLLSNSKLKGSVTSLPKRDKEIENLLDLLYQKVCERFIYMGAAFKFFD
jgi:hypothetical protein